MKFTYSTFLLSLWAFFYLTSCQNQQPTTQASLAQYIQENYKKYEYEVPMRDGVKLFTSVFVPRDKSQSYPILLKRTPYGIHPYGRDKYPTRLGPSEPFIKDKYIFVYQDVRGKYMSEGEFVWMRPPLPIKNTNEDIDEGTDTFDTIEWLLKNIEGNNGNVGMYGTSYPGFYVVAGMIDAHPNLKAVMPGAPMAGLWKGDDVTHNGAFLLPHNFGFLASFGVLREKPTADRAPRFNYGTKDGYRFFLDVGALPNIQQNIFKGENIHWNEYTTHSTYDEFWQSRNMLQYLTNVRPAVLIVGGWYDAQDLYGPLKVYETIESLRPENNTLVMGPWYHGSWDRTDGSSSAAIQWGSKTAISFRENVELPFFQDHLKGERIKTDIPSTMIFATGENAWKQYDVWPPEETVYQNLYLREDKQLSFTAPLPAATSEIYEEYVSDPQNPVPFTSEITTRYGNDWMLEDQRFAARRPDVLVFQTGVLTEDVTLVGPISANLTVSTTGTDSDFVVKLIDVHPSDAENPSPNPYNVTMSEYQQLIRGDAIRAKFRKSLEIPEPMLPGEPTQVGFDLRDIHHTFKKGHKIMVQVQSSWFPMIDRNPHTFTDLFNTAKEKDFVKANNRVYLSQQLPSFLRVGILE